MTSFFGADSAKAGARRIAQTPAIPAVARCRKRRRVADGAVGVKASSRFPESEFREYTSGNDRDNRLIGGSVGHPTRRTTLETLRVESM